MNKILNHQKQVARAMSESELQANVIAMAKSLGYLVHAERPAMKRDGTWRTPVQGDKGFPDVVLVKDGVIFWVELKSQRGELTPEQESWRWHLPYGYYFNWRPSDWLDGTIEKVLRGME